MTFIRSPRAELALFHKSAISRMESSIFGPFLQRLARWRPRDTRRLMLMRCCCRCELSAQLSDRRMHRCHRIKLSTR